MNQIALKAVEQQKTVYVIIMQEKVEMPSEWVIQFWRKEFR